MSDLANALALDALVATYRDASTQTPVPYPTPEHAGVAAVLDVLIDVAQRNAARDVSRFDHRSLYDFAATLHYSLRAAREEGRSTCSGNG